MILSITSLYGTIFKGLFILAAVGAISAATTEKGAKTASQSLRTGLISLKALNDRLGF